MPSIAVRHIAFALTLLVAVAGCRESEGELFEISGKKFIFNYRVATATYLLTLQPRGPIREGDFFVATFENPAGGDPIVVRNKIWPNMEKVVVESPPLSCVRKDRPYQVTIRIEDTAGTIRQTLQTTMTSNVDQDILPDRPLVVGPAYTPNPELGGRPDGKLADGAKPTCPVS